jgi:hypothetical protein
VNPPLFSQSPKAWSGPVRVTPLAHGAVKIVLAASHAPIDTGVVLRPFESSERMLLTGRYTVSPGDFARVMFYGDGKPHGMYDMPGDGQPREFHWDLAKVPRTPGDSLFVGLVPKGARTAHVTITLNQPLPALSADLLLMEPGFAVVPEQQLAGENLGFLRYDIGRARAVVQYDQTYGGGWQIAGAWRHVQSVSGFNLWMLRGPGERAVIAYRTGVVYFIAEVFSLAVFLLLGLAAAGAARPRPSRSE